MNEAKLSVEDARRIIRDCQMFEDERGITDAGRTPTYHVPMARYAKVTKCMESTGFGEIQFCTGNRNALVADTSLTVKCGMDKFYQVNDLVKVIPFASPGITWEVVGLVVGGQLFKDPATDGSTLASPQDNPAAVSKCTDTVTVP